MDQYGEENSTIERTQIADLLSLAQPHNECEEKYLSLPAAEALVMQ
jgi:hypothetical protein